MPNLALIILLAAFPALSTDMYLPAIPALQGIWGISLAQANLSLVCFFLAFSVFLLIHGPLSDRLGRKPVLLAGIVLFIAGCLLCAVAQSIGQLVAARMVQATGAAAASALCMALAKDLYDGAQRQKILAYIGVVVPLCPMMAPMLGGWMLTSMSWRAIFVTQAVLSLPALYGVLRLTEPLQERASGGVLAAFRRYRALLSNRRYMGLTLVFSLMPLSFYAFLGGSAAIYVTQFGLSPQMYGAYFGFNAVALMAGSLVCSRLCVGIASTTILRWSLAGITLSGAGILLAGAVSPVAFAVPMFCVSFFLGLSRPISNHMVLEQVKTDVGAASAVITFSFFLVGMVGMEAVSLLPLPIKAPSLGVMAILGGLAPMLALLGMKGLDRHGA